ncbi:Hypothetical predicted protein [Olea europaea subsp. europaea]|uniref:TRF2/HOY1 PH-like domain-containing protein n=2 Tax=Olea europaea subsp. europaea TaxID=158383 RepID=A0A8S0R199_OLEEU|nr:Hypothetical predicted protein [Olea europaea subsp. europaea]
MVEGIAFWNENCVEFSTEEFQNYPLVDFVNQENDEEDSGILGFEQCSISKRMRLSPEFTPQEGDVDSCEDSSPLGLKLRKTPSFMNLLEKKLSQWRKEDCSSESNPRLGQHSPKTKCSEKLKATNFPAILLRIGNWQWISEHEGDLTAKLYYAKHKMVWEVLGGALKSKIEIQWSDITAIRAIIRDNVSGILQIELNKPPLFFGETNPQPRKHTLWHQTLDFTGGQASIFRHYVSFAPGMLDKHYEKLLQCDQRLFSLSQKPFPSQESPYFDSVVYGCSQSFFTLNGYQSEFDPRMQYSHQTHRAPSITGKIEDFEIMTRSPIKLISSDEKARNYRFLNERQRVCNEGENVAWDESQANYVFSPLNSMSAEDVGVFSLNTSVLNEIENHLLGDHQFVGSNEGAFFTSVKLMCPLIEPLDVNPINASFANQLDIDYQSTDIQVNHDTFENPVLFGLYSDPMNSLSHQDSSESVKMESTMPYQYLLPVGDFSTPNATYS